MSNLFKSMSLKKITQLGLGLGLAGMLAGPQQASAQTPGARNPGLKENEKLHWEDKGLTLFRFNKERDHMVSFETGYAEQMYTIPSIGTGLFRTGRAQISFLTNGYETRIHPYAAANYYYLNRMIKYKTTWNNANTAGFDIGKESVTYRSGTIGLEAGMKGNWQMNDRMGASLQFYGQTSLPSWDAAMALGGGVRAGIDVRLFKLAGTDIVAFGSANAGVQRTITNDMRQAYARAGQTIRMQDVPFKSFYQVQAGLKMKILPFDKIKKAKQNSAALQRSSQPNWYNNANSALRKYKSASRIQKRIGSEQPIQQRIMAFKSLSPV